MRDLAGFGALLRLAWRRDRILIPVSGLALVALATSIAKTTLDLYPTAAAATHAMQRVLETPAVVALYGPAPAATADALAAYKLLVLGAVAAGVLACVIVRRHTRSEEEAGRLELLGAGVVGRRAPLAAAVTLAAIAVAVPSLLTALLMITIGMDARGSSALAAAWITTGLAMAGITAVAAQLTASTRGCAAIALGTLGAGYGLRAIGDTAQVSDPPGGARFLTWLSPVGWAEKVAPFGADRFAVALLGLATLGAGVTIAFVLLDRRDLGAGMIAARKGRRRASRALASPEALALRLARGGLIGWTAAFALFGALLGSISGSAESMLKDPKMADLLRKIGGSHGTLTDIFFRAELKEAAILAGAAAIAMMLHARGEEIEGRTEWLLSTATGRVRWLCSHALVALLTPPWLLLVLGTTAGLLADGPGVPGTGALVTAALAATPAAWVCAGAALLLIGAFPRRATLIWAAFAIVFVLGEFGDLLGLPDGLVALSPFDHLLALPGGAVGAGPLPALTAIAGVLGAAGLLAFRRRDVRGT